MHCILQFEMFRLILSQLNSPKGTPKPPDTDDEA